MLLRESLVVYITGLFLQWEICSARRLLGCYKDSEQRLLPHFHDIGRQSTTDNCMAKCAGLGFRFGATQFYTQCLCGDNYPPYKMIAHESKCNTPCRGNKTEMCGGIWHEVIYDLEENEGIQNLLPFAGCFEALPSPKEISNLLRPVDCVLGCKFDKFKYAGIRGTTCVCSNEAPALIQVKGTSPELCGNKMPVYFAREGHGQKYMGCYKIKDGPWPREEPALTLSQTCQELCRQKGFRYAASENNYKCHCSNERPSYKHVAPDSNCVNICETSIFEFCSDPGHARLFDLAVGHPFDPQLKLEGCYLENIKTGKLFNDYEIFLMENTPEKCVGLCHHYGYIYAGIKNGNLCRCGNALQKGNFGTCTKPCPGDYQQTCGGKDSIDIYSTQCGKKDQGDMKGELVCKYQLA